MCMIYKMQAHIALVLIFLISNLDLVINVPRRQVRVIGGKATTIEKFPYQASLMLYGEHFCGGSVIGNSWILTAAHCIEDVYANELTVRVGSGDSSRGGFVHKVSEIHAHPYYDDITIDYDFALLKLKTPIKYNAKIQPIVLAASHDNKQLIEGTMLSLTGWGTTEKVDISTTLLTTTVPYLSPNLCARLYPGGVTPRMFCAGYPGMGGKDACQGDSGGPLAAFGKQFGVVSWGDGCGEAGAPGVYATVATERQWIRKVSGI